MKIVVGSANPVKIEAVKLALDKLWPTKQHKLDGISAKSDVSEQPLSDEVMLKGAKNRAQHVMDVTDADIGVGIEGGLHKIGPDWYGRSWMVAINRSGTTGVGSSVSCLIPEKMMELVHRGKNMSEVCEALYGVKNIGQAGGYFGILTGNAVTRASGYRDGVIMALSAFADEKAQYA